jgi:hypothetical protein
MLPTQDKFSHIKLIFMKINSIIRQSLMIALLIYSTVSIAHPGGHYNGEGAVFNNWQLKNGKVIKGNFSMGKSDFILLEQENGNLLKVAIKDLGVQDQLLARFKIKKYEQLNIGSGSISNSSIQINPSINYYLFFILIILMVSTFIISKKVYQLFSESVQNRTKWYLIASYFLFLSLVGFACKKTTDTIATTNNTTSSSIPKTTTGFIDSAFAPNKPSVSTRWDDTYFYVSSNGIPAHNMMVGITNWQQQVPIPQFYTGTNSWSIPLQPVYASVPLSTKSNFMKGAVALAVNGIPIFNALNNRSEDSYLIGELDNWGGHCGKGDDYHYHAAPLHLSTTSGLKPIAFALDGFAVYGEKEPDGSTMQTLDTCHGHTISSGVYHYHGTTNYPYVVGAMKGKVSTDPSTAAPENQILPQAFSSPLRPATTPLSGASIKAFASTGTNAYKLTYQVGANMGYVEYSWDASNKYTFKLTSTAGAVTTNSYQR